MRRRGWGDGACSHFFSSTPTSENHDQSSNGNARTGQQRRPIIQAQPFIVSITKLIREVCYCSMTFHFRKEKHLLCTKQAKTKMEAKCTCIVY
ncbi:hypothetical protein SADUNF_Sadunf05G0184000 [Salix dunnii]|uniref:Uncharacterized protein n=1 Tax=Salix dunnii TaxID=1413687 RepID=A0A835MZV1_9ROSI|nr:hypothetical protein SADUNF_Sadunf05G0184000 [Salix dunnii]